MSKKASMAVATVFCSTLVSLNAVADDHSDDDDNEFRYGIGLAAFTGQSPYIGGKTQTEAIPYLEAQWGPVYFRTGDLGVYLYEGENWELSAGVVRDVFGDTDRGDSRELKDMEDLDDVYNASIAAAYESKWGEFELQVAADISSNHEGEYVEFSYGYPIRAGKWSIGPTIGALWFSEEISQYYVGVTPEDSRPGRPVYTADSGVLYKVGLEARYSLNEQHNFLIMIENEFYPDEITDSPIIDDSSAASIIGGYVYRF